MTVGGHKVYGVYIAAGTGYRDDTTSGIATGDNPEGEYAIFDGTHYNGGCCFDYGNAETSNMTIGNGTMEAIYFGNIKVWGYGSGNGPWVMADLENGLFSGVNAGLNSGDQSITVSLCHRDRQGRTQSLGDQGWQCAIRWPDHDVQWTASERLGYNPMHKEGAIILGIGGDNSKGSVGTFFEGAMTSGYPSDATDNAVQASIVAAGYGSSVSSTPTPTPTNGTTPTPTPTSGTTPTPTPTHGTTPTPISGASCSVHYAITNQWSGGFGTSLTITNTGSTVINGWSLQFSFPNGQTITQLWNGSYTQSGSAVTITNVSYNGSIPAGGTVSSAPGFNGSWSGSNGSPTAFALNGATCTVV